MNISKKILFPMTLSSLLAMNSVTAFADVESTAETAKDKTGEVYKNVKQDTKEAWKDVKSESKKAWANTQDAYRDGIIAGKLETALVLNKQLNPFKINFDVDGDKVTLMGTVDTDIEKDLAKNIALGINGVKNVDNQLVIEKSNKSGAQKISADGKREFSQYMRDVSLTASIKTELLANDKIDGLDINVDTYNDTVTLQGKVKNAAQKSLAEAIVKKRDDVERVVNKLKVQS